MNNNDILNMLMESVDTLEKAQKKGKKAGGVQFIAVKQGDAKKHVVPIKYMPKEVQENFNPESKKNKAIKESIESGGEKKGEKKEVEKEKVEQKGEKPVEKVEKEPKAKKEPKEKKGKEGFAEGEKAKFLGHVKTGDEYIKERHYYVDRKGRIINIGVSQHPIIGDRHTIQGTTVGHWETAANNPKLTDSYRETARSYADVLRQHEDNYKEQRKSAPVSGEADIKANAKKYSVEKKDTKRVVTKATREPERKVNYPDVKEVGYLGLLRSFYGDLSEVTLRKKAGMSRLIDISDKDIENKIKELEKEKPFMYEQSIGRWNGVLQERKKWEQQAASAIKRAGNREVRFRTIDGKPMQSDDSDRPYKNHTEKELLWKISKGDDKARKEFEEMRSGRAFSKDINEKTKKEVTDEIEYLERVKSFEKDEEKRKGINKKLSELRAHRLDKWPSGEEQYEQRKKEEPLSKRREREFENRKKNAKEISSLIPKMSDGDKKRFRRILEESNALAKKYVDDPQGWANEVLPDLSTHLVGAKNAVATRKQKNDVEYLQNLVSSYKKQKEKWEEKVNVPYPYKFDVEMLGYTKENLAEAEKKLDERKRIEAQKMKKSDVIMGLLKDSCDALIKAMGAMVE